MANQFATALINANLDVLGKELLPLIQEPFAQTAASESLERLRATANALLDENPSNKAQVSEIWGNLGSDPELVDALAQALTRAALLVDDEKASTILKVLVEPLTATIAAMADNVHPNAAQLKVIWLSFFTSDEFRQLLLANLELVVRAAIKNQSVEDLVVKLIKLVD